MPEASVTVGSGAASDPGARILRVPDGAASQRVDRFVADVTGLSRSHVQKLISAGNLTSDGVPLRANSVVGPGTPLRLVVPEPELDHRVGVLFDERAERQTARHDRRWGE